MAINFLSDDAVHGMLDSEFSTVYAALFLFVGNVFTATNATERINDTGHGLSAGACVMVKEVGTLPTGLSKGVLYFVINPTANDFQLALTPGGSAVTFSDDGTGANEYSVLPNLAGTGGTEVSTGGYARQLISMAAAASRAKVSNADVNFTATGADYGEICAVATYDAVSSGNLKTLDPLGIYRTIMEDDVYRIASGNVIFN